MHKFLKNLGATILTSVTTATCCPAFCASDGGGGDGNVVTSAKGTTLDLILMVWVGIHMWSGREQSIDPSRRPSFVLP